LNGLAVFAYLLLLFILVPLIELAVLIRLYHATNLLTTLAIVILTGVLGAALARRQGFEAWQRIQSQLSQGKPPASELLDGLLILIAGVLLVTPGILTDVVGFSLLVPSVRALLRGRLARRLVPPQVMQFHSFSADVFRRQEPRDNEIEAEYTVEPGEPPATERLPKSPD
jgi:UPF0716 protein FxsA